VFLGRFLRDRVRRIFTNLFLPPPALPGLWGERGKRARTAPNRRAGAEHHAQSTRQRAAERRGAAGCHQKRTEGRGEAEGLWKGL